MLALDLYCGAGGAALGMIAAGFSVVGVDIRQPTIYPGEFIQADALMPPMNLGDFDLIWTSPPCQRYSVSSRRTQERHPDLIPPTRALIADHPMTVIENVPGAPLIDPVALNGPTMGLPRIERKRLFELSFYMLRPPLWRQPRSKWRAGEMLTITGDHGSSSHWYPRRAAGLPGRPSIEEAREVMGFETDYPIKRLELSESVPPPYARYIATAAMERLKR